MKLGMISLGCAKNLIDTELFLGVAKKYDLTITNNIKDADIIVINTCGFIENAKKEAIDTILNIVDVKKNKTLIVMGCLVERYLGDLKESIPEVDIYFPIRDYNNIDQLFNKILNKQKTFKMDYNSRVLTTLPHSAYIRIAEGCDNKCSYCAIPLIRGKFRSRPFNSIIEEAKSLASQGVKEITLIAQDTTRYGTDLKEGKRLEHLLHEISLIDDVKMVRVLYLYPDEIKTSLIIEMNNNPKIAPYFDIPIQHISDNMLKAMNRRGSKSFIKGLIYKIKTLCKSPVIRTTLIVGFPGETEKDFNELYEYVKEAKFDKLGVFTYSDEEDTKGYEMEPKVDQAIMDERLDKIMSLQNEISLNNNKLLIGETFDAIIDKYDDSKVAYIARSYHFAPDDVDGCIYIKATKENNIKTGDIISVTIIDADNYDLYAKFKQKEEI